MFTLASATAGTHEISLEVYSAFDRLTFNVSVQVTESGTPDDPDGPDDPDTPAPGDDGNDDDKGCGGAIEFAGWGGGIALGVLATAAVLAMTLGRKKKSDK